ncbi:MAG: hypothetical protein LBD89_02080 [Tannerellaceae bacterium]|jgi:hypothetical protein|nr:hypothetical protein [Tannerellaceae bacterium]
MKRLHELLAFPADSDFQSKAKDLMLNFRIEKTSGGRKTYYYINEIELYYYSKEHPDESVHPHFYKDKGLFRTHFSGVDITFKSNWEGYEEAIRNQFKKADHNPWVDINVIRSILNANPAIQYGGLLIREIEEEGSKYPVKGPWRVLCELFYMGDANDIRLELTENPNPRNENDYQPVTPKPRKNLGKNARMFRDEKFNFSLKKK